RVAPRTPRLRIAPPRRMRGRAKASKSARWHFFRGAGPAGCRRQKATSLISKRMSSCALESGQSPIYAAGLASSLFRNFRLLDHALPFVDVGLEPRCDLLGRSRLGLDRRREQPLL